MVKDCKLGRADVILGMNFGGTRYKYFYGVFIDEVLSTGEFRVSQAGRPTKSLGSRKTLAAAKRLACSKAEMWPPREFSSE